MRVLAIGNSFSQDATRYLHDIARADGVNLDVINLYIGGCPLSYHFGNTLTGEKLYELEFNGGHTGFHTSVQEALSAGSLYYPIDVVTVQQVSRQSFLPDTYHPYLEGLAATIRTYAPKAKLMVHQTWAYQKGTPQLAECGFDTPEAMFEAIRKAYEEAASTIQAHGIIPSGAAFYGLMKEGIYEFQRDFGHADMGFGRYILGLVWYEALTGNSCIGNTFRDFDAPVSEKQIALAQRIAHDAVTEYRK